MHRLFFLLIFSLSLLSSLSGWGASLSFSGNSQAPIELSAESSTGLDKIYVLRSALGVTASYTATTQNVTWMRYSNLGGGYAEEIESTMADGVSSITLPIQDYGYIIEDGTTRYYFWITNYANHIISLDDITFNDEQDCDRARLVPEGDASRIVYYTINGQSKTLSRELSLSYNTLSYDETSESYLTKPVQSTLEYIDGTFSCVAPLCNTQFTLSGDRFMKKWSLEQTVTSASYTAVAVEAQTSATQDGRDYENEQSVETDGLGGSGPVLIAFHAAVTDAAIYTEWQLSNDSEFESVYDRYYQLDFDYTFTEQGTTYVRFVADNADATCEYDGDVYTVFVGESSLLCPNAFSPGASEGVNDEWRVSYKSIIDFDCHIFNRWGQEMIHLTNPGQGWDGKYKGKLVPAGAYYYVIKAKGSDGQTYNLSGDINIIRARTSSSSSSTDTEE